MFDWIIFKSLFPLVFKVHTCYSYRSNGVSLLPVNINHVSLYSFSCSFVCKCTAFFTMVQFALQDFVRFQFILYLFRIQSMWSLWSCLSFVCFYKFDVGLISRENVNMLIQYFLFFSSLKSWTDKNVLWKKLNSFWSRSTIRKKSLRTSIKTLCDELYQK